MLKLRGWLQDEKAPSAPNARTCQNSEVWSPVIHGSEIGTATAGVRSELLDQMTLLSAPKSLLVESSNSYRVARGTGAQANDGVRENVGIRIPAVARESLSFSLKFWSAFGLPRDGRLAAAPAARGTTATHASAAAVIRRRGRHRRRSPPLASR